MKLIALSDLACVTIKRQAELQKQKPNQNLIEAYDNLMALEVRSNPPITGPLVFDPPSQEDKTCLSPKE